MPGIDANTKLMLHMNGTDASTTFIDNSPSPHTVVANGNAQIDTAEKKFGTGSLLLDNNGDYLSIADSNDWDIFGSNLDDWTVDFQVKHNSLGSVDYYIEQSEASSNRWYMYHVAGSGLGFAVTSSSSNIIIINSVASAISDSNWHHVALIKVANKYAVYLDGIQTGYTQDNDTDTFSAPLKIGITENAAPGTFDMDGWIDEFRIQHSNYFNANPVIGLTDTITVPTEEYKIAGFPHSQGFIIS